MNLNMHPVVHKLGIMAKQTPKMRYDGSVAFCEWQKAAKEKLSELLGMDKFQKCDESFSITSETFGEEYKEYRFTLQSEENYHFPCVLRIPNKSSRRNSDGKLPLVICLQGHSRGAHVSIAEVKFEHDKISINERDSAYCVQAVKEGYAAMSVEQRSCGVCGSRVEDGIPDCEFSSMIGIMMGRTAIGERVWDVSCAIDAVENHFSEFIDLGDISLMGSSGGGTASYYAACLDERIKCVMPSASICTWEESITALLHCLCNYVPHIAEYFNMGDIGGMIAPRGLVVVNGAEDDIFRKKGVDESFEIIKSLYSAAGVPENCVHVEGPNGHRFYAALAWPVFNEMKERLKKENA